MTALRTTCKRFRQHSPGRRPRTAVLIDAGVVIAVKRRGPAAPAIARAVGAPDRAVADGHLALEHAVAEVDLSAVVGRLGIILMEEDVQVLLMLLVALGRCAQASHSPRTHSTAYGELGRARLDGYLDQETLDGDFIEIAAREDSDPTLDGSRVLPVGHLDAIRHAAQ